MTKILMKLKLNINKLLVSLKTISYMMLKKSLYISGALLTISVAIAVTGDLHTFNTMKNFKILLKVIPLLAFIGLILLEMLTTNIFSSDYGAKISFVKNIIGVSFCILSGYWSYLDEGLVIGTITCLLLFAIMSTGDILLNIDELFDLSKYVSQLLAICILIAGFIGIIGAYNIFFSGLFIGSLWQKSFLLFLITAPCFFFYRTLLPKDYKNSYDDIKIIKVFGMTASVTSMTHPISNFARGSLFILYLTVFRTLFYDIMYVPSGSMTPTLRIGDFVLVNKSHYGLANEMMWPIGRLMPWIPVFYRKNRQIKRNDIVVWTQDNFGVFATLVKRVVAIGGDTFSLDDNHIIINDQECSWIDLQTKSTFRDNKTPVIVGYKLEETPDGQTRIIQTDSVKYIYSDTPKYEVPVDHFCVVGDNRTCGGSHDCRDQSFFPPIHKSRVIGYPKYIVLSSRFWLHFKRDSGWVEFIGSLPVRAVSYFKHINIGRCCKKVQSTHKVKDDKTIADIEQSIDDI